MVILVTDVPSNALKPISVRLSGRVTPVSDEFPLNVELGIAVTPSGISIFPETDFVTVWNMSAPL